MEIPYVKTTIPPSLPIIIIFHLSLIHFFMALGGRNCNNMTFLVFAMTNGEHKKLNNLFCHSLFSFKFIHDSETENE